MLESGHGIENEMAGLVLDVQAGVQQTAAIGTLAVVGNFIKQVLAVFFTTEFAGVVIRITAFVGIVVVDAEIEFPVVAGQPHGTDASASGLHFVYFLVEERVGEESVGTFVVSACREGKAVADAVVVGKR